MKICIAILLLFSTSFYASDGEVLSQENCASCHEDKNLNLLSLSSMTYYSQAELMNVLQEGKMKQQAQHLSVKQIEAIVQYLTTVSYTHLRAHETDT